MAELKTKPTALSVAKFIGAIKDEGLQADCRKLVLLMEKITRSKATMWGTSIVGFGSYHYVYASGRGGDWPLTGFSPRKQNLTVYLMSGAGSNKTLLSKLGKVKTGKSCLYIKRLADIDIKVLETLIRESVKKLKSRY